MYMDKDRKKIKMKYPKGAGNVLWDGRTHSIKPVKLSRFTYNNNEFYVLDYLEENGEICNTILRRENNSFYKVPLYDYSNFDEICTGAIEVSLSILDNIEVITTLNPVRSLNEVVSINNNDDTFRIGAINSQEVFDSNRKPRKEITRESMLEDALFRFTNATKWRYGMLPTKYNVIRTILNQADLNILSDIDFNRFIEELEEGLNSCIETTNGVIYQGPANVDLERAIYLVMELIRKYSKKQKENVTSPLAAAAGSPPPPPYNPTEETKNSNRLLFRKLEPEEIENIKRHLEENNSELRFNVAMYDDSYKVFEAMPKYNSSFNRYEYKQSKYFLHDLLMDFYIEQSYKKGEERIIKPLIAKHPSMKNYLDGKRIFFRTNQAVFTLDLEEGICYVGINEEVKKPTFIYYNFSSCKDKEMFDAINAFWINEIKIEVPNKGEYLGNFLTNFQAERIFKKGLSGNYTLLASGYVSEGKENKQQINSDDDFRMGGFRR